MTRDAQQSPTAKRWSMITTTCVAAIGLGAVAVLVSRTGAGLLLETLALVRDWLPALLVLELLRIGGELVSTYAVLGPDARHVPMRTLVRAQLVAHACGTLLPMGRATGEAAKAAAVRAHTGTAGAVSLGVSGQIISLWVNGATALLGAATAALAEMPAWLCVALASFGVLLVGAAAALQLGMRAPRLLSLFARRLGLADSLQAFDAAMQRRATLGAGAVGGQLASRALQALQLTLLAAALGASVPMVLAPTLQAIYLVGASVGDAMPAQLGAVDGAFAAAAHVLRWQPAVGVALAIALHGVQLAGAGLSIAAALLVAQVQPSTTRRSSWETRSETR